MSADGGRLLVGLSGWDGGRLWNHSGTGRLREWCVGSGLTRERDVNGEVWRGVCFAMSTAS